MLDKQTNSLFNELLQLTVDSLDDENDKNRQRDTYIEKVFRFGGKPFADRIEKYGFTEKGDKVEVYEWFREYLALLGDFRVPYTLTTGGSQCGKSLGHNLLLSDVIVSGKMNVGFFLRLETLVS